MPSSSEASIPAAYDADVIVVGAGPVGLTTGCALRHHGVGGDARTLVETFEARGGRLERGRKVVGIA